MSGFKKKKRAYGKARCVTMYNSYGGPWRSRLAFELCVSGKIDSRCMDWHHKQHASMKLCRTPSVCGCVKDNSYRESWRNSIHLCTEAK